MKQPLPRHKRSTQSGGRVFLLAALLLTSWGESLAQSGPDAGRIRQLIEQSRPSVQPLSKPERPVQAPAPSGASDGLRVSVREFRFVGNTLVDDAQLHAAVQTFVGRELNFSDLQRAANSVAAAYREAGWVVRVFLPEQDIAHGAVTLNIVEARFGQARFEGPAPARVLPSELQAYFTHASKTERTLRTADLERAQLLIEDLPGVRVTGIAVAGEGAGQTDMLLRATDKPLVTGDVGWDNTGARATGSRRATANLYLNSPGLRGELISLNALYSAGSDYARVAMTVPVPLPEGRNGLRLGVNGSSLNYKVVDGPSSSANLPIHGHSGSMGLELRYPFLRSLDQNLYLSGHLENKTFFNQDTQVRSDYASNSFRLDVTGQLLDKLGAGGASNAAVQLLWGQLTDMTAHNQIDTIARHYHKVNYSVSRNQTLSERHAVLLSLNGQYASQRLDSSERFYIGGAQSVRAYPVSELGGDQGELLSMAWRWTLNPTWSVALFADQGRVLSVATASDASTRWALRGRGLGIDWQGPDGWLARVTWAHRNGSNPQPTSTGTDSDGTLRYNRLWFTTSVNF